MVRLVSLLWEESGKALVVAVKGVLLGNSQPVAELTGLIGARALHTVQTAVLASLSSLVIVLPVGALVDTLSVAQSQLRPVASISALSLSQVLVPDTRVLGVSRTFIRADLTNVSGSVVLQSLAFPRLV